MINYVGMNISVIFGWREIDGIPAIDVSYKKHDNSMERICIIPIEEVEGKNALKVRFSTYMSIPASIERITYDFSTVMNECNVPMSDLRILTNDRVENLLKEFEHAKRASTLTVRDVLLEMHHKVGLLKLTIGYNDALQEYYCSARFSDLDFDMYEENEDMLFYFATMQTLGEFTNYRTDNDTVLRDMLDEFGLSSISFTFDNDIGISIMKEIGEEIKQIPMRRAMKKSIDAFLS